MILRYCAASFVLFFCGNLVVRVEAQTNDDKKLKSFYIVTHDVSDASPFRYEYVLEGKPQGEDVAVREIRIAPGSACSGVTVKAADHLITDTNPEKVASANLCSLRVAAVASAIRGAKRRSIATIDDTASYSIVAMCGKTEKVFELPYPETVDLEKLKETNPRTASLWDLAYDVHRRAFGENFSFHDASPNQDEAFQALGAEIVPAIKSGLYKRGFANGSHLESLLTEYSGPVKEIDPWYVEFVGSVPAQLSQYQLPKYPPLARQTRTEGQVHLAAVLDPQTGLVKDVQVISGNPILVNAAIVPCGVGISRRELRTKALWK